MLFLIINTIAFSQQAIFSQVRSETVLREYPAFASKNHSDYKYSKLVRVRPLSTALADGRRPSNLDLTPPGVYLGDYPFKIRVVSFKDKKNYLVEGHVPGDVTSTAILRVTDGILSGTIRANNKTYTLSGLDSEYGILQRKGTVSYSVCPSNDERTTKEEFGNLQKNCRSDVVRILVAYTTRGRASVPNRFRHAQSSIDLLNSMLRNSDVRFSTELAGVIDLPEYTERQLSIRQDIEELSMTVAPRSLAGAATRLRNERQARGADYVVVMTDGNFEQINPNGTRTNILGRVSGIGVPNRYAIVDAESAIEKFVFSHEVGHLFGGRHEAVVAICRNTRLSSGPDFNGADNHANVDVDCKNWPSRNYAGVTTMFSVAGAGTTQNRWRVENLPLFSHPGWAGSRHGPGRGVRTGTAGLANNVRTFNREANRIENLENQCDFTASIAGLPGTATAGQAFSLSARSAGCARITQQYRWSVSSTGLNYQFVTTDPNPTISVPNTARSGSYFYVRLTVVCEDFDGNPDNNPTATALRNVYIVGSSGGPGGGEEECPWWQFCATTDNGGDKESTKSMQQPTNLRIYPNPVSRSTDRVQLVGTGSWAAESTLAIHLFSADGRLVANTHLRVKRANQIREELVIDHLAPGMYIVVLRQADEVARVRMIIN